MPFVTLFLSLRLASLDVASPRFASFLTELSVSVAVFSISLCDRGSFFGTRVLLGSEETDGIGLHHPFLPGELVMMIITTSH